MYLGIDLGTSNSAVAGYLDEELRLFKTAEGMDVLPSVLHIDRRGNKFFGKRAYDQSVLSPENTALGFKRRMGTRSELTFAASGVRLSPEECSAEILRELVRQASVESGGAESAGAVVTTPAAFNQMQSEATLEATQLASLGKVVLLQEPIAAAMAAMRGTGRRSGQFLVYDLGGGTFDLALISTVSGAVSILGHEGINMLGGRDFDRTILNEIVRPWLFENFDFDRGAAPSIELQRVLRVAQLAAERAKIDLSSSSEARVFAPEEEVRARDRSGSDVFLDVPLSRGKLDASIERDVARTISLCRALLADNHVGPDDIDRLVFVGGPTKMPLIREMVPAQLGIPADLSIDPMTAVALGAAIFGQSRDWTSSSGSARKALRPAVSGAAFGVRLEHPASSAKDREKVRVHAGPEPVEIQIESDQGDTSGRRPVEDGTVVEVPLRREGVNRFRATLVAAATGLTQQVEFSIERLPATVMAIPATLTLAVKVRESAQSARNELEPILKKGTSLPASGEASFRAAHEVRAGSGRSLAFEVYQVSDDRVKDPELNLHVGNFIVSGTELPEGTAIRSGDPVNFTWSMSESGILTAKLELPTVGQVFDGKFFVPGAGHRSYDGEDGRKVAESMLEAAERDLTKAREALGDLPELGPLVAQGQQQREALTVGVDEEVNRRASEEARLVRQQVSRLVNDPRNRRPVLERELKELVGEYEAYEDAAKPEEERRRFTELAGAAREAIAAGTEHSLKRAQPILDQMRQFAFLSFWRDPGHVVGMFKLTAAELHLAIDRAEHERFVAAGMAALRANDVDGLREATFGMIRNQATVGGAGATDVALLASLLRG